MNVIPEDRATDREVARLPQASGSLTDGRLSSIRQADHHHLRAVATRRVLVVGADVIVVEALAVALDAQPDMRAIGTATSLSEAVQLVAQQSPDVVVVHLPRPDVEVMDAIATFRTATAAMKVVLLAATLDHGLLAQAAGVGVAACLSVDTGLQGLMNVIRSETGGAMVVGASFLPNSSDSRPAPVAGQQTCGLTARELQVLALLAEGSGQQAIASQLVISVYTARGHVKNVLRKLGAHSQLEAIAIADRKGVLRRSSAWDQTKPTSEAGRQARTSGPLLGPRAGASDG